jgi:hypothetical protein
MNILQLFYSGFFWGMVFGLVFSIGMLIIGRVNAEMILNNYPPDIRARYGPMSQRTRKQAKIATLPLLAALGVVVILALQQFHMTAGELTFLNTFLFTTILFQTWNLVDLILLDWLLLMGLKPRFMILAKTEGMAGYKDYGFHFRKFLNGIVFTLIPSLIVTVLALAVQAVF